jgi:hypothetical protein
MGHPSMVPRGGTASARLALAWSSHVLLLWNAAHGRRGSMPHGPRTGARDVPSRRARPCGRRATCRSPPIDAAGLGEPVAGGRGPPVWAGYHGGRRRHRTTGVDPRGQGFARVNACEGARFPARSPARPETVAAPGGRRRAGAVQRRRPADRRRANSQPCAAGLRMPARAAMSAGRRAPALPRPESVGRRRRRLAQPHPGRPTARSNPASATPWSPTRTSGPTC